MNLKTASASLASLAVGLWLSASAPRADAAAPASLSLAPAGGTNLGTIRISDPGNLVWVMQSSANFSNWTELAALKPHNGSFTIGLPAPNG